MRKFGVRNGPGRGVYGLRPVKMGGRVSGGVR